MQKEVPNNLLALGIILFIALTLVTNIALIKSMKPLPEPMVTQGEITFCHAIPTIIHVAPGRFSVLTSTPRIYYTLTNLQGPEKIEDVYFYLMYNQSLQHIINKSYSQTIDYFDWDTTVYPDRNCAYYIKGTSADSCLLNGTGFSGIFSINNFNVEPTWENFKNNISTNLSQYTEWTSLNNIMLAVPEIATIDMSRDTVNLDGTNLDLYLNISNMSVGVINDSCLFYIEDPLITFYNVPWNDSVIMKGNATCTISCYDVNRSNTTVSFRVNLLNDHFYLTRNTTVTPTPEPEPTPPGPTGGSSGGSSSSGGVALKRTCDWEVLEPGVWYYCNIGLNSLFTGINFTVGERQEARWVKATVLASFSPPADYALGYLGTKTNINGITRVVLYAKIPRYEFTKRGTDPADAAILAFNNWWIALQTKAGRPDSGFYYFTASSKTLSDFAVVTKLLEQVKLTKNATGTPTLPKESVLASLEFPISFAGVSLIDLLLILLLIFLIVFIFKDRLLLYTIVNLSVRFDRQVAARKYRPAITTYVLIKRLYHLISRTRQKETKEIYHRLTQARSSIFVHLKPRKQYSRDFSGLLSLYRIHFRVRQDNKNTWLDARRLESYAPSIHPCYEYFAVKSNIKGGYKIRLFFKVSKSWIVMNRYTKEEIVLMHFDDERWTKLETVVIDEDSENVYFAAIARSFGCYAISAAKSKYFGKAGYEDSTALHKINPL